MLPVVKSFMGMFVFYVVIPSIASYYGSMVVI